MKIDLTTLSTTAIVLLVGLNQPSLATSNQLESNQSIRKNDFELLTQGANDFDYWAKRCDELTGIEQLEACDRIIAIDPNIAPAWSLVFQPLT